MTIAACYLSSEGVVFGADSTSTVYVCGPDGVSGESHHLDYAQKVFQVGQENTLGITMWGMGAVSDLSHRTLIAQFADDLMKNPPDSVKNAAERFSDRFWREYTKRLDTWIKRFQTLQAKKKPTEPEQNKAWNLRANLSGGYCLGGYVAGDRTAHAFEIAYHPGLTGPPKPKPLKMGAAQFWGCPNIMTRVLYGMDENLYTAILSADQWQGNADDLLNIVRQYSLVQPSDLPLREAIDWVNTVIYTTIKAMKFSHLQRVCGGPIEIAVISTDRLFRWVKHKRFDEALV